VSDTRQQTFATPAEKTNETLAHAKTVHYDAAIGLASGGTDSLCAIDAYRRYHNRHDLRGLDAVVHTITGTTVPQTTETIQQYCADHGIPFIPVRQADGDRMLAPRVLEHGWPMNVDGKPGHWSEFVNRKLDTWDKILSYLGPRPETQLWVSGARHTESDRRARTLGDRAVSRGDPGDRRPQTWVAPCHGWTDGEKADYIADHDIPVTPAYDFLGYSGDCTACAFDDPRVLNDIYLLAPELAMSLSVLVQWTYTGIRAGEIDAPLKRAVWGMPHEDDEADYVTDTDDRAQRFAGCSGPACRASKSQWGDAP
jgi:3'-phosphoadenosine 5'-phosphosulfate sulfotransferase (PAPS reductase)/FAD synthetase